MKLLDEKGIGTVWSICKEKFALVGHTHNYAGSGSPGGSANSAIGVVDYGEPDEIIQIGYHGEGITGDQIKYIAGYTTSGNSEDAVKIKDVSKDALKAWLELGSFVQNRDAITGVAFSTNVSTNNIQLTVEKADGTVVNKVVPEATEFNDGIMSKEDKVKLDGIASGANNYTLPVASANTLGGVKTSIWYTPGNSWPIYADSNNKIYTRISGLEPNNSGSIGGVTVHGDNYYTGYNDDRIIVDSQNPNAKTINFPSKSGTFALTSDIPDVSNLCGFNFVSSISECVNGRINFLFKNSSEYVDLSFLRNLENSTILLIYSPFVDFQITDKGSVWYYNGRSVASEDTAYIGKAKLVLAFFNYTYVYVCTFSYN